MNPKWAEENLQTIRTLMERSALYRRALAPVMIYVGVVGILGGVVGWWKQIDSDRGFVFFWGGAAVLALAGSFFLVRRQAIKDSEPFWSPPTRRVTQALMPAIFIGAVAGFLTAWPAFRFNGGFRSGGELVQSCDLPMLWIMLYGCALNAAGFFMVRGIRFLSRLFLICGFALLCGRCWAGGYLMLQQNHLIMGEVFGGLHFAYGIYLYLTEKKSPDA